MHKLTYRHHLKGPAREVRGTRAAGRFIDFTQRGSEVARRDISDGSIGGDILQEHDPSGVARGTDGVELNLYVANNVEIMRQWRAIPYQT